MLIGRVTTAFDVTLAVYPIPTASSGPLGYYGWPRQRAAVDPDERDKVGCIALDGTVSEFAIPTAASSVSSIAAAPDGALWFTESDGNRIGRITTGGRITEFPIPTRLQPAGGHHRRARRRGVVHRGDRQDRPHQPSGRHYRIHASDEGEPALRHHGRPRTATSGSRSSAPAWDWPGSAASRRRETVPADSPCPRTSTSLRVCPAPKQSVGDHQHLELHRREHSR